VAVVPGYEASVDGRRRAKDTPSEVIAEHGNNTALADPKVKARLCQLSSEPIPTSPADFGKLYRETDKWGSRIRR
jgi:hypothetical protein